MPIEVKSKDELMRYVANAVECRVYRNARKGYAKIKVRTKRKLVTMKVPLDEVDPLIQELNCENLVEIT